MTTENESGKERVQIRPKSTLEILREAPHLTIRDPRIYQEMEQTLLAINPVDPEPVLEITQEQSMSLNSSHILHIEKDPQTGLPDKTVKLVAPERIENKERESDWFKLLEARGIPTGETGPVSIPKVDAEASGKLALVMSYEYEDLSKYANIEDFLTRVQDYLSLVREIKPTEENRKLFGHGSTRNLETPSDSVSESKDRIKLLKILTQKLAQNDVEETASDVEEAKALYSDLEKDAINQKLEAEIRSITEMYGSELVKKVDQDLVCIDSGDLNPENFNYRKIDGKSAVAVHDGEYAQFQSQLYSVAYFINHPRLRNLFSDQETYKRTAKRFLVDYARNANLTSDQINQLNTFVATSHLFWEATLAKTIATGRKNFREISGGIYKSRLEAVRKLDYPLLSRMVNEGSISPITEEDLNTSLPLNGSDPEKLVRISSPVGDKYPITRHHRWAGEIMGERVKKWVHDIRTRLKKAGIKPETDGEIANNPPNLLGDIESIENIANEELFLVLQKFDSYYSSLRTGDHHSGLRGRYGFLVESEQKREQEGNLLFITTDMKMEPGTDESSPPFSVGGKVIDTIRSRLPFADELCENLERLKGEPGSEQANIDNVRIVDTNSKYFSIVILSDDQGQEYPIVIYRTNSNGSAGGAFVVKEGDRYQLIENRRVIIPQRDDVVTDCKNVVETYRDFFEDDASVAQETGMKAFQYKKTKIATVRHDSTTDISSTNMYILEKIPENRWENSLTSSVSSNDTEDDLETIHRGITLSGAECVASFGNLIKDPMTTVALSMVEIREDRLKLAHDTQDEHIVLERVFDIGSADFIYRLPRGPRSKGNEIGTLFNDTGKSRIDRKISSITFEEADFSDEYKARLVSISTLDVFNMIRNSEFDDVTSAALIIGMLNRGILTHKA